MGNDVFHFKNFSIRQDRCAMKVCTDAALFGAWVAEKLKGKQIERILDIGTGTGLLSLQLAQTIPNARVDAVEIEAEAASQAADNFSKSSFSDRLKIIRADVKTVNFQETYDHIISNPPFFASDLPSPHDAINLARHGTGLDFKALVKCILNAQAQNGSVSILLPSERLKEWEAVAGTMNENLSSIAFVQQTEKHAAFRVMLLYNNADVYPKTENITIREQGVYSKRFREILNEFYLEQAWK